MPQDAPGQTGKPNRAHATPADGAGGRERAQASAAGARERAQDASRNAAARANLQRLPTISGEPAAVPDQASPRNREATPDQIFASEKEALKQESRHEKRTQRQTGKASSQLVEALEQQAQKAQAAQAPAAGQAQAAQAPAAGRRPGQTQVQKAQAAGEQPARAQAAGQHPHQAPTEAPQPQKPVSADGQALSQAETQALPRDTSTSRAKAAAKAAKASLEAASAKQAAASRAASKPHAADSAQGEAATESRANPARIALIAVLVILCIYLLGFSWNQWMRGDDETDIQGVWQIAGTESTVTITKDYIQITPDVKYPYTIDTAGKTITFSFADLSGVGRYRFSLDRDQLAIIEGPSFSTVGNTFSDIFWFGRSFFWWVFTQEMVSPGVETTEQRNQKEAAKQAEIDQEKAEEAQEAQEAPEEEIKAAASSDYVLGSQLIKKAEAIKGIKSTAKKDENAVVDLPTECTLLIRTDQPVEIASDEKPVMVIELRDSSGDGQSGDQGDGQSDATQEKKPLIIDVPSTSSSGQSSGSASGGASAGQSSGSASGGADNANGSS